MAKKRYCLYLSRPLAHKLERVASQRHGSKSALLEEALRKSLEPEQVPGVEEGLLRRLNELHRALAAIARDQRSSTRRSPCSSATCWPSPRPFPTATRNRRASPRASAIDVFLVEVGKRVAGNGVHTAEVLRTVPVDQPDLFATASAAAPSRPSPAACERPGARAAKGRPAEPKEGGGHA